MCKNAYNAYHHILIANICHHNPYIMWRPHNKRNNKIYFMMLTKCFVTYYYIMCHITDNEFFGIIINQVDPRFRQGTWKEQ